jgi:hypothetical protein
MSERQWDDENEAHDGEYGEKHKDILIFLSPRLLLRSLLAPAAAQKCV